MKNVVLLFEQSGTFKKVFNDLGYNAFDVDIENNFNHTDLMVDIIDIFSNYNIKGGYFNAPITENQKKLISLMDDSSLIFAFFPCTYFSQSNGYLLRGDNFNNKRAAIQQVDYTLDRFCTFGYYYDALSKLAAYAIQSNKKLIIENPYHENLLLKFWCFKPSIIDYNRYLNGDFLIKPTMYYFFNLKPIYNTDFDKLSNECDLKYVDKLRGFERSFISYEYAYNFVRTFINLELLYD